MKSPEIREKFLKFFENHGHQRVKSSSLIPAADPTLLFTNAGMVQFKDCFLGINDLGFKRATTSQKCVRAGGKHNDLENVGFTPRHHTFFEMLGNFSFGDYFKEDAIALAWELLTKGFQIPKDRLQITVFEKDDEALELWKKQGVPEKWITRLGEKENFWAMGDTGPCGPCTEIHFDTGKSCGKTTCTNPGCDCGRFLEIWNLVFMQFNRDTSGKMTPLPKPSVDTGSGLERVAAVLQGASSNYGTDVFQPMLQKIAARVGKTYGENADTNASMHVIADHLRSSTFLVADGVIPSNEGRGYVLRRILRRAIRHGKKLGQERPFIHELVGTVSDSLGSVYPELVTEKKLIETMIREEEERFHETLHRGMGLLEDNIARTKKENKTSLSGEIAFKLYDTFGFPLDLVEVIAAEHQLKVDDSGFNSLMEKQRSLSTFNKGENVTVTEGIEKAIEAKRPHIEFLGYESLSTEGKLLLLFDNSGKEVASLAAGEMGYALFDKTPFYAESGGQVGDLGEILSKSGKAQVHSTTKIYKVTVHHVKVSSGKLEAHANCSLQVDPVARFFTATNHTATHMLHAALRKVLGDRVKQAGSLVDPQRLRFDFTYPRAVSEEELEQIEKLVNEEIVKSNDVSVKEMSFDDALKTGALAFFDEKYGNSVRVIRVGGDDAFSIELCGGTHLTNTIQIGLFKIVSESSVSSGVRRIEGITSSGAINYLFERNRLVSSLERTFSAKGNALTDKIEALVAQNKALQKETEQLKLKLVQGNVKSTASQKEAEKVGKFQLHCEMVENGDAKILRAVVDQYRDKLKEKAVVALATKADGKVSLCIGLTKDIVGTLDAGKMVKELAPLIGGSGGGRPDFAQAGGTDASQIPAVFEKLREILSKN